MDGTSLRSLFLSSEVTEVKCQDTLQLAVFFFFSLVKNVCDDSNLIRNLIGKKGKKKTVGLYIIPNQQHHLLSA